MVQRTNTERMERRIPDTTAPKSRQLQQLQSYYAIVIARKGSQSNIVE